VAVPVVPAPAATSATLTDIRKLAETIRDNRALLAQAFQKFVETGDPTWNAKSDEYDKKVAQLVQEAKAKAATLSPQEQAIAADLIAGNFNPQMGYRYLGQAATPPATTPTTPAAVPAPVPAPVPAIAPVVPAVAPAPGVICKPTAEGGQVCSNGTCIAPGAVAPVTAADAPAAFPYLPVGIGVGVTALIGTLWYLIARK
jgi:hypothetical protein